MDAQFAEKIINLLIILIGINAGIFIIDLANAIFGRE